MRLYVSLLFANVLERIKDEASSDHFLLKKGRSGHFCVIPPWFYVIEGYIQPYGLGGERLHFNSNQVQRERDIGDPFVMGFK
jgi:hypothetical protein